MTSQTVFRLGLLIRFQNDSIVKYHSMTIKLFSGIINIFFKLLLTFDETKFFLPKLLKWANLTVLFLYHSVLTAF